MTDFDVKKAIQDRRSVRTFDGRKLSAADLSSLRQYADQLDDPFGIPLEFRFLNAKEHGLSSPVIVGTDLYAAMKLKKGLLYEAAAGYAFEKFCLYAVSLGLGTVMLAGTLNRSAFEKAMEVGASEVMPVVTPLGYPAEKMSLRESLMRKGVKADKRLPFGELFFDGSFTKPLTEARAGHFLEALRMVQKAPSAVNKQPWRLIVNGSTVHFYEQKEKAAESGLDIQKVDIGIAMAHLALTLEADGLNGRFLIQDPGIDLPEKTYYIASYQLMKV